jgi:hypothetical protein
MSAYRVDRKWSAHGQNDTFDPSEVMRLDVIANRR